MGAADSTLDARARSSRVQEPDSPLRTPRRALTPSIVVGFLGIALVLLGALVLALTNVGNVYENTNAVAHTNAVKAQLETLLSTLVDAETGERGFIITGDPAYLEPYNRALSAVLPDITRARQLTADNAEQQSNLVQVSAEVNVKLEELARAIQQRQDTGFTAAQAIR